MIPVNIYKDGFSIKNISSNEIEVVRNCINEEEENFITLGRDNRIDYEELEQRYLESLMNSLEYFCGIYRGSELIGIIKGRIENKAEDELWILSYLLLKEHRNQGIGTKMLIAIEDYFHQNYSIDRFCILILSSNSNGLRFWMRNHYSVTRKISSMSKGKDKEMIILDKIYDR